MMRKGRFAATTILFVALIGAACGSDSEESSGSASTTSPTPTSEGLRLSAQVASYDLAANRDQRVIVGLSGGGKLVSFGTTQFAFAYLGSKDKPDNGAPILSRAVAQWSPVPGQSVSAAAGEPQLVDPSAGVGVYAAEGVRFDRAGLWGVKVSFLLDGKPVEVAGTFDVQAEPAVVAPDQDAPRSENHLPGAAEVPPKAVDSRSTGPGNVPDPELHSQTMATAIASGRPTMLVISTPVYCVSRFCGPITDSVQRLAKDHSAAMNFVHIEVWRDFEAQTVNKAAAEWILPKDRKDDVHEPWVFLVGVDGKVAKRWDNVASDADLLAAVRQATG